MISYSTLQISDATEDVIFNFVSLDGFMSAQESALAEKYPQNQKLCVHKASRREMEIGCPFSCVIDKIKIVNIPLKNSYNQPIDPRYLPVIAQAIAFEAGRNGRNDAKSIAVMAFDGDKELKDLKAYLMQDMLLKKTSVVFYLGGANVCTKSST